MPTTEQKLALSPVFGRAIDRATADRQFSDFVILKKNNAPIIKDALADEVAIRYYCGRGGEHLPECEDLAFVFDKISLQQILDMLNRDEADGMIVFNGKRNLEDSTDPTTGQTNDVDGRPTVLLFPFQYRDAVPPEAGTILKVFGDQGSEHPGTGVQTIMPGRIPDEINVTDIFGAM